MPEEIKLEEECPTCGKKFKNLAKHKCKKATIEEVKPEKTKKKETDDAKQEVEENLLVKSDDYLSAGVHIGTKFRNKLMSDYIYKIRNDGLAIFNIQKIDEKLRLICNYLSKFNPEEIIIFSKRNTAAKPLKMINHTTGIKTIIGRYLPGSLTNPNNDEFMEPKVVIITDKWYDKQALTDSIKSGAVIITLCNTNTVTNNMDIVMPCNNKGQKSLSLIYWIIAREYAKAKGIPFEYEKEKFI